MIGIIGGSGLYSLLEDAEQMRLETPFGSPSSPIATGKIGKHEVAFLARHGPAHELPPHRIPYKANIWALAELGVDRIFATAAVGSLKKEIKPGEFVVPDQFVNFTHGRDDTFYHGPGSQDARVTHISTADPFCPQLRQLLIDCMRNRDLTVHDKGTVVVIQGPRFSSRAESEHFRSHGWDIINMTLYPECVLARELQICYAPIALVTDYDTGVKDDPSVQPVSIQEVLRLFKQNNEKLKNVLVNAIENCEIRKCECSKALEEARI
jgi:5'-methylthioadenosine phosphorylase